MCLGQIADCVLQTLPQLSTPFTTAVFALIRTSAPVLHIRPYRGDLNPFCYEWPFCIDPCRPPAGSPPWLWVCKKDLALRLYSLGYDYTVWATERGHCLGEEGGMVIASVTCLPLAGPMSPAGGLGSVRLSLFHVNCASLGFPELFLLSQ